MLILSLLIISQTNTPDQEFLQLQNQLKNYGFEVKIEATPVRGSYGLFNPKTKQVLIDPIVFSLGIAKPTLIHEAVHVAQYCKGKGEVKPLGLKISPPNVTRPYFMHYQDSNRRYVEAEAYTVQSQENSLELVTSLISQHCKKK